MLMIEPPPPCRIAGMATLVPRKTPLALTSMTRSHSSTAVSSTRPRPLIPALLTRISSLPNRWTVASTALCQSASRVTSRRTNSTSAPVALSSASNLRPSSSSTSPMVTLAPSLANKWASPAPMPRAPPLIRAIFPWSRIVSPLHPCSTSRATPTSPPSCFLHRQRHRAIGILLQQQAVLDQSLCGHDDGPRVVHCGSLIVLGDGGARQGCSVRRLCATALGCPTQGRFLPSVFP